MGVMTKLLAVAAVVAGCGFSPRGGGGAPIDAETVDAPDGTVIDATVSDATPDAQDVDAAPQPVPFFVADFEGDIAGQFTGIYDSPHGFTPAADEAVRVMSPVHAGQYAMKSETDTVTDNQAAAYVDFSSRDELHARFWLRVPAFPSSGRMVMIASASNPNVSGEWMNTGALWLRPDRMLELRTDGSTSSVLSTTLTANTWHEIEIWVERGQSDGRLAVQVDGGSMSVADGVDTGSWMFSKFMIGIAWQEPKNFAAELYIDDVALY